MPLFGLPYRRMVMVSSIAVAGMLAACGDEPAQQNMSGMKVPVSVVTVQPTATEVYADLPGRVEAIKDAQIRARVTGIVKEINFQQGGEVKEGQLLFTIDPAPYEAELNRARAELQRAEADAGSARLQAQRYATLVKSNAISRQEYDNAVAASKQAEAAIAAAQAAVQSAEINLGYTRVDSPIDGRIGKSMVTEGALVSAQNATQMATVQQLSRVYVDITRSTTQLSMLRKALEAGILKQASNGKVAVQVLLDDGSAYPHEGALLFSGVTVDPSTGQVTLRAEFDNPEEILLPGMYVRVRVQQGVDEQALLVPMQAIQRTPDGLNTLMVVRDGVVNPVAVAIGPEVEGRALIYKGLSPGDMVVVEGFQKIRPGAPVQPMPWKPGAGPAGAGGQGAAGNGQAPSPAAQEGAAPAQGAGQDNAAAPAQG
ncbi:efflux RND transporter periplasmic adaptor subunit [Alcaligenaceae bacterium]|nr:efflux RND transporter periplasmic adaptor subunit [Alcaligenaceae bacterium]